MKKEFCNPFMRKDGREIKNRQEWEEQRRGYLDFLQCGLYGNMPKWGEPAFGEVISQKACYDNRAVREVAKIRIFGKEHEGIKVTIVRPQIGERVPVIVWNCYKDLESCPIEEEAVCERKFAIAGFDREEIAWDGEKRGILEELYPECRWGRIAQWSWGSSRIIDYLETTSFAQPNRYLVTGHSRGGKVSLCTGMFDERVALCHANDSGCCGAGSVHFTGSRFGMGIGDCESLHSVYRDFPYWWGENLGEFADGGKEFPIDAHIMRAMVAPRAILTTEAYGDTWSNPYGTLAAWRASQEVFSFLGCPEHNGIHYREGGHGFLEIDWRTLIDYYDMCYRNRREKISAVYFPRDWKENEDRFDWKNIRLHYGWHYPRQETGSA